YIKTSDEKSGDSCRQNARQRTHRRASAHGSMGRCSAADGSDVQREENGGARLRAPGNTGARTFCGVNEVARNVAGTMPSGAKIRADSVRGGCWTSTVQ